MAETRFKLGTRFHVTVGKGKYDAILFLYKKEKSALFALPIRNILWDRPISEFNLPSIHKGEGGEGEAREVLEEDIKSYIISTRFGGIHPEKWGDVVLETY